MLRLNVSTVIYIVPYAVAAEQRNATRLCYDTRGDRLRLWIRNLQRIEVGYTGLIHKQQRQDAGVYLN